MTRSVWVVLGLTIASAACTSTVDTPAACPDISGNYKASAMRTSGTCDPKLDEGGGSSTVAFSKNSDGSYNVVLTNVPGGCPGHLDAATCKFTANCEVTGKDGSVVATFSLDYTFSSTGYKGTSIAGARPPAVPAACDVSYSETATKL